MGEVYAWPEGRIYLYTGAATASGSPIAYVQNTQLAPRYDWSWDATIGGNYRPHLVGKEARVTFAAMYANNALFSGFNATAQVHIKFEHSGIGGSAGFFLYSARIDGITYMGTQDAPYTYSLEARGTEWSAF